MRDYASCYSLSRFLAHCLPLPPCSRRTDRTSLNSALPFFFSFAADDSDPGITAFILTALSVLLIIVTMPFSLCLCIKVTRIECNVGRNTYVETERGYRHKLGSVGYNVWRWERR